MRISQQREVDCWMFTLGGAALLIAVGFISAAATMALWIIQ